MNSKVLDFFGDIALGGPELLVPSPSGRGDLRSFLDANSGAVHMQNNRLRGLTVQIWRLKKVMEVTGLGRSTIYQRVKNGNFPKPICLGTGRAVGWLASEIEEWIMARIKERNEQAVA